MDDGSTEATLCNERDLIRYLSPETDICSCPLALLFGSRHAQDALAAEASRLFREGYFERLIISGGYTMNRHFSEAREIADKLVASGIPMECLMLEEKAGNTGENVLYSRALAGESVSELLVIGKVYAKRRYAMTIRAQWPEIKTLSCFDVNYFGVAKHDWQSHPEMRNRILGEARKIPVYLARGYLKEVQVRNRQFILD
jgi:uncharacterized SAM-binding protein YcdF (DUF218 family)